MGPIEGDLSVTISWVLCCDCMDAVRVMRHNAYDLCNRRDTLIPDLGICIWRHHKDFTPFSIIIPSTEQKSIKFFHLYRRTSPSISQEHVCGKIGNMLTDED